MNFAQYAGAVPACSPRSRSESAMKIGVPKEIRDGENRVAIAPESVKKFVKAGISVAVQAGAGERAYYMDKDYLDAGATIEADAAAIFGNTDFIFKTSPPMNNAALGKHEVDLIRSGAMLMAPLTPTRNIDLVKRLAERGVSAFSTDQIPRSTRAQSMDTLSSMANIAGYKAVLIGAVELSKYFPMFMTAAGTILASRVFVIGAGVAGLQAIATAKRLGAIVEATDTRPVVKEQVESVGGRFVGVDTTESAQDAGGYAKKLSEEFYRKQAELIGKHCGTADVVITTALIGGVFAPKLITAAMVEGMKPGSVIVDLAAEAGGNCELTKPGQTAIAHGVKLCGPLNLPSSMPLHASLLWSRNMLTFVMEFWKKTEFVLDLQDDIIAAALITHKGEIIHGPTKEAATKS